MMRRFAMVAASVPLLFTAAACGSGDDLPQGGPQAEAEGEQTTEGRMGGAGIRSDRASLYLQKGSLSNKIGTRDGGLGLFTVECSPEKITVKAGDGVNAVFTVGSQDVVFYHQGKEFARSAGANVRKKRGKIEWGAGSSFEVNVFQLYLENDDRVSFHGSVTCP